MKKSTQKLFWLMPIFCGSLLYGPVLSGKTASVGVDCSGTPHTRLETTICAEPALRALDRELTAVLAHALQRGVIDSQAIYTHRNRIARQCWREPDEAFGACLIDASLKAIERVVARVETRGSARDAVEATWRYQPGFSPRVSLLQRQLAVADASLRSTGNPELKVVTIIELIDTYEQQQSSVDTVSQVTELRTMLATGCTQPGYDKQWQALLKNSAFSCASAENQPGLLSSSDY